jgi:hypothetical protein
MKIRPTKNSYDCTKVFEWIGFFTIGRVDFRWCIFQFATTNISLSSDRELEKAWEAYCRLEKPVLIHWNAGIGRTGKAVPYIKQKLKNLTRGILSVDDL